MSAIFILNHHLELIVKAYHSSERLGLTTFVLYGEVTIQ